MKNTDYKNKAKQNIAYLVLFFIVSAGLIFLFWQYQYTKEKEQYLSGKIKELDVSFSVIEDAYNRTANVLFDEVINQPEILTLFRRAGTKDKKIQDEVRQELFKKLNPVYQRLKQIDVRQLHFHLPNSDSFLRFHKPSKYGDNLKDVRYSLVKANTGLTKVVGFEEGRIKNGFRYVFPVIFNREHLGSVEISLNFNAIKKQLIKLFQKEYSFILKKSIVSEKVFQSEKGNYKISNISREFVVEKDAVLPLHIRAINTILKPAIQKKLYHDHGFAKGAEIHGENYIVVFYPVSNVKGDHVAWVISYAKNSFITNLFFRYCTIYTGSIALLAVCLILFYFVSSKNRKLDTAFKEQQTTLIDLREVEANFHRVFSSSIDAILLIKDGVFIDCNDSSAKMLGAVGRREIINTHPSQLSPQTQPDGRSSHEKADEMIVKALKNGSHRFEWEHKRMNGECFPAEVSLTALHMQGEMILHVSWKDLTKQKLYEKSLQQTAEDALAASKAKTMFLANMSHDIRTPMNGILGMTRLALETKLDPDQKKLLDSVMASAENLLGLLNDILDLSKIEAGQLSMENYNFSLNASLDHLISSLSFLAKEKNISLEDITDYTSIPTYIKTDELRLMQILTNIAGNAVKFTDSGGVTIKARIHDRKDKTILLHFTITDTGVGIDPAKHKDIFDSFTQAEASITRKFGGSGLGLAISKQLIELMGGKIWVESNQGKGSVFHFTIAAKTGKKTLKSGKKDFRQTTLTPLNILLVEDNEINQELARTLLEKDNHKVKTADNGLMALQILIKQDFDVILMDVQMPTMDGMSAASIIRSCEKKDKLQTIEIEKALAQKLVNRLGGRHITIIAMTANAMREDREKCLAAGMDDYLTKPFMPEQVQKMLKKYSIPLEQSGS